MSFPWSSIEQRDRQVNLLLGKMSEAHLFRKELPKEAVEILVGPSLPGMVRVGKVYPYACMALKRLIVLHFCSVVERDTSFEVRRQWGKELFGAQPELFLGCMRYVPNESVAALSLNERNQIATVTVTANGVSHPMTIE